MNLCLLSSTQFAIPVHVTEAVRLHARTTSRGAAEGTQKDTIQIIVMKRLWGPEQQHHPEHQYQEHQHQGIMMSTTETTAGLVLVMTLTILTTEIRFGVTRR